MNIKNKVILVTGASDGIGREIAFRLAKEQVKLALIARNKDRLTKVLSKSKKLGAIDAKAYICDIRNADKLQETTNSILSDFGTVDVLINNAGIWQKLGELDNISKDTIDSVINTNLTATIHLTKLLLPTLRKREESAIINIISKSGVVAQNGQSVYSASKYGMRGFTDVLKLDLKNTTVRVAGIYQGGVDTDMFAKTGENFSTKDFINPSDLADVVAYILTRPQHLWIHDIRIDR